MDTFSNLEPLVPRGTIDLLNFADGNRLSCFASAALRPNRGISHRASVPNSKDVLGETIDSVYSSSRPRQIFSPDLQQREIALYLSGFWHGGGIEVPRGTGELACRPRISSEFESTALVSRETSCICLKALLNFRQSRFSWRESSRLQTKKVA